MNYQDRYLKGHLNCSRSVDSLFKEADKELQAKDKLIAEYEAAIRYTTDYLDENKLNSIGYQSKAHMELLMVLTNNKESKPND